MGVLRYHFGTGHGPVHHHVSPADLDLPGGSVVGRPDAVRLDVDGDGRADDALWDADGDGVADHVVLDLDDDGRPERAFTDPSGSGVWGAPAPLVDPSGAPLLAQPQPSLVPADGAGRTIDWLDVRGRTHTTPVVIDSDGDGVADAADVDADHDPRTAERVCDLDGDGHAEQLLVDHDHDAVFEDAYASSAGPGSPAGRWDVLLADIDGDGLVELAVPEGGAGWVPP